MPAYELTEHDVTCPFCWQVFALTVDTSVPRQSYIEDCTVCCHPIVFDVECTDAGEVLTVSAKRDDD